MLSTRYCGPNFREQEDKEMQAETLHIAPAGTGLMEIKANNFPVDQRLHVSRRRFLEWRWHRIDMYLWLEDVRR